MRARLPLNYRLTGNYYLIIAELPNNLPLPIDVPQFNHLLLKSLLFFAFTRQQK